MMTDESLQVITTADRDTEFGVRVNECFEVSLPAKPKSGHLWEVIDQPDGISIESWRWDPEDLDPYEPTATETPVFRVWRMHATEPGTFDLNFRCWQPWEGPDSICDDFAVVIEAS